MILTKPIPADRHPALVYLASLSRGSLPAQRSALRKIAEVMHLDLVTMDWGALRYQHVQHIRARLQERYAATTANRLLTALRRVLHEAWKLGYIAEDDYRKMADVEPIRSAQDDTDESLAGRALSIGELAAILSACIADDSPAGARDAAIVSLGYGLGLRRAEIAKMQLAHYDKAKSVITVKSGKGNKSRTLPIDNGTQDALDGWLELRGQEPGPMFYGVNKGGRFHSHSLNVRAIGELYEKRAAQAMIKDTHFHDLRRSFVSDLLDNGIDLVTVSRLAGHADPRTTARYDRRKMETRRKAIGTLHIPYTRRK